MTVYRDKKSDPRTYKEPPIGAPAPTAQPDPVLRCGRPACEQMDMDVTYVPIERRAAYAVAHGYVEVGGKAYCSKRCAMIHDIDKREEADRLARPKAVTSEPVTTPMRVTVAKSGDDFWIVCDRWVCSTRFKCGPESSKAPGLAVSSGFVETPSGTFCSKDCARHAKRDIDSGMQELTPKTATERVLRGEIVSAVEAASQIAANKAARAERGVQAVLQALATQGGK